MKIVPQRPDKNQIYKNEFIENDIYPFNKIGRCVVDKITGEILRWCDDDDSNYEKRKINSPDEYYDPSIVRIIQAENGKLVEWDKNGDMQILREGNLPLDDYIVAQGDWGTIYSDGAVTIEKLAPNTVSEYNIALAQLEEIQNSGVSLLNNEGYSLFDFENIEDHKTLLNDINNAELKIIENTEYPMAYTNEETGEEFSIEKPELRTTTIPTPINFGCLVTKDDEIYMGEGYNILDIPIAKNGNFEYVKLENGDIEVTCLNDGVNHFGLFYWGISINSRAYLYAEIECEKDILRWNYSSGSKYNELLKTDYGYEVNVIWRNVTSSGHCQFGTNDSALAGDKFIIKNSFFINGLDYKVPNISKEYSISSSKIQLNGKINANDYSFGMIFRNKRKQSKYLESDANIIPLILDTKYGSVSRCHLNYDSVSIEDNTLFLSQSTKYLKNESEFSSFFWNWDSTSNNSLYNLTLFNTNITISGILYLKEFKIFNKNLELEKFKKIYFKKKLLLNDMKPPINFNPDTEELMVYIPAFYYKREWDNTILTDSIATLIPGTENNEIDGFKVHPAFVRPDGTVRPYILVGAFMGNIDSNNMLRSIPNVISSSSLTIEQFRTSARLNRNNNFNISNIYILSLIQLLYKISIQHLNSSNILGLGASSTKDQLDIKLDDRYNRTGDTMKLGNKTGYDLFEDLVMKDLSGNIKGYNSHISFLGIEDIYGNKHEVLDGIVVKTNGFLITNDINKYGLYDQYDFYETETAFYRTTNTTYPEKITNNFKDTFNDILNFWGVVKNTDPAFHRTNFYCDDLYGHKISSDDFTSMNIFIYGGYSTAKDTVTSTRYSSYSHITGIFLMGYPISTTSVIKSVGARLVYLP